MVNCWARGVSEVGGSDLRLLRSDPTGPST